MDGPSAGSRTSSTAPTSSRAATPTSWSTCAASAGAPAASTGWARASRRTSKAAIEWSASQRWSTGDVGMYGKSYDAVTGLVGNNLRLEPLKAVVAQEPLWNMYNYLFSNGVARPNVTGTPDAYNGIATMAPLADDTERYKANAPLRGQPPGVPGGQPHEQQQPGPRLGVLARPQPRRGRRGHGHAAVHHPGLHREQHQARGHGGVPRQPPRRRAGLDGAVGARPRQRDEPDGQLLRAAPASSTRSCASTTAT